jgi:hypothetical protein
MSIIHEYKPFTKPECTTTVEEMNAKLEVREAVSKAVQSPRAKSSLEWEKPVDGVTGLKTKCGRYSCGKVTVNGTVSYELWKLTPGGGWFRQLNKGLDNFLQVQKLAQLDADKR